MSTFVRATALVVMAAFAPISAAVGVPLPPVPEAIAPGSLPEGSVPAIGPASAAPVQTVPAVASQSLGQRTLQLRSRGDDVHTLQDLLRARGYRVTSDGLFGQKTRAAVRKVQRRLDVRATGIVDVALLRRLGVRIAADGATPAPTPTEPTTYPLAGPDAAHAKYLKAFPVRGKHTYFNDYGAPRSQGSHEGNDVMAARGVPLVAVADGVITRLTRAETGLGGVWVWLRDAKGNTYYYAHMNAISDGLAAGDRVKVGQQIGTVGNTGDARYGATHVHFEVHPGAGGPINPYQDLVAVDPKPPKR